MYSVESPAFTKKLSALEVAQYGPRFTGVGAQILGADDKYIWQYSEESHNFWGSKFLALELIKAQKHIDWFIWLKKLLIWLILFSSSLRYSLYMVFGKRKIMSWLS